MGAVFRPSVPAYTPPAQQPQQAAPAGPAEPTPPAETAGRDLVNANRPTGTDQDQADVNASAARRGATGARRNRRVDEEEQVMTAARAMTGN